MASKSAAPTVEAEAFSTSTFDDNSNSNTNLNATSFLDQAPPPYILNSSSVPQYQPIDSKRVDNANNSNRAEPAKPTGQGPSSFPTQAQHGSASAIGFAIGGMLDNNRRSVLWVFWLFIAGLAFYFAQSTWFAWLDRGSN
ncbi:hypothetical protein IFR04_012677 [Cadophora malorum]|uniref:Uncharacterized protein n=1 Tax=Cadophora malorum TaxID=108018 RepID=A0A8H7W200_9HELO|nr:hypothetical protein IFR04_012677 [Cadophora malorum]